MSGFAELKDDGSTACGCWIYSGVYPGAGPQPRARAQAGRRTTRSQPDWGFAWPANRRMLYNRASADPDGQPWSRAEEAASGGTTQAGRWVGHDVPDFEPTSRRTTVRPDGATGMDAIAGDQPFIMKPDGAAGCSRRAA